MSTETQHLSDSELSASLSDSDDGSDNGLNSPVTKKQKKGDAPESGSLFPSADDTVMSDEQVRATKWAKWDELCESKNGELYFPKGEDGLSRTKWEDLTMEYEPTLTRADLKDKHIVELAMDRGMTEEGDDRDDVSEGEELDADELIRAIQEGTDNLKRPENKKSNPNKGKVGRPREGIDKLQKYKDNGWQTGLTAKQWIEYCDENDLDKTMPLQWFCKQKQMWFFRVADLGRATNTWKWQKLLDFDPDKTKFYGEVGVTGHRGAVGC